MADPDAASPAVESHIDEVREEMMAIQDAICDFIGNYKVWILVFVKIPEASSVARGDS